MLPVGLLERLVESRGVSACPVGAERRQHPRYTIDAAVTLHRVEWRIVMPGTRATLRDISRSGVGVVLPDDGDEGRLAPGGPEEWVVWFGAEPRTTFRSVVMLCQTVRRSRGAGGEWVLGGRIEAVLAPRHTLTAGVALHTMEWVPMFDDGGGPLLEAVGRESV
jgi:hypothetical protein